MLPSDRLGACAAATLRVTGLCSASSVHCKDTQQAAMTAPEPNHDTTNGSHASLNPHRPVVAAVIPAWNRPSDLAALLGDLGRLETSPADLRVLIVDNGSDSPLAGVPSVRQAAEQSGKRITFHQLGTNRGGSGGFNAGITQAMARLHPDYVWLIDSDARLDADVLTKLLAAMQREPGLVAVGPSIADPATGDIFEAGGRIDRATGRLVAALPGGEDSGDGREGPIDYIAACCALVRAGAIRQTGLLPDTFIHTDDVMWCQRLAASTGGSIGVAAEARCTHPRFDRFKTWARYYEARNWAGMARLAKIGPLGRFRRASREIILAIEQTMIGSDDLARLHIRGLQDAAAGHLVGKPAPERTACGRFWPWHSLGPALRAIMPSTPANAAGIAEMHSDAPVPRNQRPAIGKLLRDVGLELKQRPPEPARSLKQAARGFIRLLVTPSNAIAMVHAAAHPHAWAAGRLLVCVSPLGYRVHRLRSLERLAALCGLLLTSVRPLVVLTLWPPEPPPSAPATPSAPTTRPSLSIVILTRNRIDQLVRTLETLRRDDTGKGCEIIVVDNASTDGTPTRLQRQFPDIAVIPTGANLGVEGFNRGVQASTGDAVLILDDDAWPDTGALAGVLDVLARRPDVAAVTLHRQHPRTQEHEWPFAHIATQTPRWPDMGPGNVVRRSAWDEVGGYEKGYFLYRNDTDLALKLLAAGHEVFFTPEYKVWHDSPIVKAKTARWLFRSTRNWVWLAKRHGRRGSGLAAILTGWLWAHRLAGGSPGKHAAVLRGVLAGCVTRAPKLKIATRPDGRALARLIRLKLGLR